MSDGKKKSSSPAPLSCADLELLAAAFAGELDADEVRRQLAARPDQAQRLAAVATGLTRAAAQTMAPYRDAAPTVLAPAALSERRTLWHRRAWLSSAAALALLATAAWIFEFRGRNGEIARENIAYSLATAQVRGAGDTSRREWVVRVERSSPAIAYLVRMVDGVPVLEQGQLILPSQQRYVLTPSPDASHYFLLLLAPDGPTARGDVERILRGLGRCGPDWSGRLGAALAEAREPWFALAEIELPENEP